MSCLQIIELLKPTITSKIMMGVNVREVLFMPYIKLVTGNTNASRQFPIISAFDVTITTSEEQSFMILEYTSVVPYSL